MPENYLYEYAVIRLVPRVEREEFINAGVILFSKPARFIGMLSRIDADKLRLFGSEPSPEAFRAALGAFEAVCYGRPEGGPVALLEPAERFRWLTAARSTCLQTSRPHPGLAADPATALQRLFEELVL